MNENILYSIAHPINALRAKARQVGVSIDHASPPTGSTIEEFPELPIQEAAELMGLQTYGGVRLEDWSLSDQERMKNGLAPLGHPEHPNI